MAEHPIQGLMTTAMENLKEMVDVNTIVGEPVETPDGSVILPVSKVGFGFAAGGSEFVPTTTTATSTLNDGQMKNEHPFGGGSGGGVSITPVAFLVVSKDDVRSISLEGETHIYDRILDLAPQVVEKIQNMLSNGSNKKKESIKPSPMPDQPVDELLPENETH